VQRLVAGRELPVCRCFQRLARGAVCWQCPSAGHGRPASGRRVQTSSGHGWNCMLLVLTDYSHTMEKEGLHSSEKEVAPVGFWIRNLGIQKFYFFFSYVKYLIIWFFLKKIKGSDLFEVLALSKYTRSTVALTYSVHTIYFCHVDVVSQLSYFLANLMVLHHELIPLCWSCTSSHQHVRIWSFYWNECGAWYSKVFIRRFISDAMQRSISDKYTFNTAVNFQILHSA
jgi:hypothetical protein